MFCRLFTIPSMTMTIKPMKVLFVAQFSLLYIRTKTAWKISCRIVEIDIDAILFLVQSVFLRNFLHFRSIKRLFPFCFYNIFLCVLQPKVYIKHIKRPILIKDNFDYFIFHIRIKKSSKPVWTKNFIWISFVCMDRIH